MHRPATRFVVGALVFALSATAGCGAQKQRTIKAEFASAQTNLDNSRAASVTLRLKDSSGSLSALLSKESNAAQAAAFAGGSITVTVDPVGTQTLKDLRRTAPGDAEDMFKDVNMAFVVRDDKAALGEIRIVGGNLYIQVNLTEIDRLAKAGGVTDFDAKLDDAVASADSKLAQGIVDLRAGKWIKLPLARYFDQLKQLGGAFASPAPSTADTFDVPGFGRTLYDAVQPFVTVTDANNNSDVRVLDVKVQARPALKAALKVLAATDGLPYPDVIKELDPAEIDKHVAEGTANGTITLRSGHLSQVTVDLESLRLLDVDPGTDSLAGTEVVVDIDDSSDAVQVPDNVSSFDLGAALEQFLQGFTGSLGYAG